MHHLSSCSNSKQVQISASLPWDFPSTIHNLINTLNACFDDISKDDLKNSTVNKVLFPIFFKCSEIASCKQYKDSPLLDKPLSTPFTRKRSSNISCGDDTFFERVVSKYKEYISALIQNLR